MKKIKVFDFGTFLLEHIEFHGYEKRKIEISLDMIIVS